MIEKFEKKMSIWKRRYLSSGGRIALIKAFLSNLLIHDMSSVYNMPKVVGASLDWRRNFVRKGKVIQ